jgi:hypothetical protein
MIPAGKSLVAILVGFLVWLVLAAPALVRSAQAAPFGARRTVSLVVLAPFDALSHVLRLSQLDAAAQSALGRNEGGGQTGPGAGEGLPPSGVDASPPPTTPPFTPRPGHPRQHPIPQPTLRKPTKSEPLTVLAIGDSIGIDLGLGLQRVMGNTGYYKVIVDGKISTGLARPDFFNWPAQLQLDIIQYDPDILVVLFGLNDPQAMRTTSGTLVTFSRPWFNEYSRRVNRILELGTGGGRRMVWAGGPIVSDRRLRHDMNELNGSYRKQVRLYPRAFFFDTWKYTSSPGGSYTAFLRDADGNHFEARTGDGDHFTNAGEDYLARILYRLIRAEFLARGTPIG